MAASAKRDLFISINGSIDGLRNALKAGKSTLLDFDGVTGSIVDELNAKLRNMGSQTGDALTKRATDFTRSIKSMQASISQALSSSDPNASVMELFNTNAIQAQIGKAQQLAAAQREVAEAAQRVATAGGANAESAKVMAVAYATAAVQTEQETDRLQKQLSVITEVDGALVKSGDRHVVAGQKVTVSAGQQRAAMQQLSYQIGDVAQGFAAGTPPLVIFSQQSGQVIQALQLMTTAGGGALSTIAAFAPYVGAALVVLSPFVAKLFESGDAIDKEVDKLRKDSAETEVNRQARERFNQTLDGQIAKWKALNDEITKSIKTEQQQQLAKFDEARGNLNAAYADRVKLTRDLAKAQADLNAMLAYQSKHQEQLIGDTDFAARLLFQKKAVADLTASLGRINRAIPQNEQAVREAQIPILNRDVTDSTNAVTAATDRYTEALGRLQDRRAKNLISEAQYSAELKKAQQDRDAAIKSANGSKADARTTAFGDPVAGGISGNRISGRFGETRPGHMHAGVDIAVPVGTPVYATADGVVKRAGNVDPKGYGNLVEVNSGAGTSEIFAHLSRVIAEAGQAISKGDLVGYSGGTRGAAGSGDSQGAHLHYEVRRNGKPVDPTKGSYPTDSLSVGADAASKAARDQKAAQEHQRQFDDQMASARQDQLQAQKNLTKGTVTELDIELQAIEEKKNDLVAKVEQALEQGKIPGQTKAEQRANADKLEAIYRETATIEGTAALRRDLVKKLQDQLAIEQNRARNDVQLLNLELQLAPTQKERLKLALEAVEREYQARRAALNAKIEADTTSPTDRKLAEDDRDALDRQHPLDVELTKRQNADPLQQYMTRLKDNAADLNSALKGVEADGLQSLEDGLIGIINGTESAGTAFKKMASSIVADLARIAVESLILKAVGGPFGSLFGRLLGHSTGAIGINPDGAVQGHATGLIPGYAAGVISGPGTGTSDSILALLGNRMIRVSNGESIITAKATKRYAPLLRMMNDNTLEGYANGLVGPANYVPSYPAIPDAQSIAHPLAQRLALDANVTVNAGPEFDARVEKVAVRTSIASADPIASMAQGRTMKALNRRRLPGGWG